MKSVRLSGANFFQQDRIDDAVFEVFVHGEGEATEQLGLGDKDQAVVFREVLEEQADLAQRRYVHEVRVVDDGGEHLAGAVQAARLLDEAAFAAHVDAICLDLKRLAQDAQRAVVSVERAVDDRRHDALGVVLACARGSTMFPEGLYLSCRRFVSFAGLCRGSRARRCRRRRCWRH
jgi:hypothetical protein